MSHNPDADLHMTELLLHTFRQDPHHSTRKISSLYSFSGSGDKWGVSQFTIRSRDAAPESGPHLTYFCIIFVRASTPLHACKVSSFNRSVDKRGVPKFKSRVWVICTWTSAMVICHIIMGMGNRRWPTAWSRKHSGLYMRIYNMYKLN